MQTNRDVLRQVGGLAVALLVCIAVMLAVYALLRAAAEADHGSEEMYQRMQHKEGRR